MHRTFILCLCSIALSVSLCACGGKTSLTSTGTNRAPTPPAPAPVVDNAPRNTLSLSVPALAGLQPGADLEVQLSATMVEPLFQASARVLFDPTLLEPVSTRRGQQIPGDAVFLCSADRTLETAAAEGRAAARAVPFAFTGLPGQSALAAGKLELARIRFRVKGAITGDAGLRLLNDPRFLQLRSVDGQRLAFDLVSEAGAR